MSLPDPDTVVVVILGSIVGLFVLLMAAFGLVYTALSLVVGLFRAAGLASAPPARRSEPRLRAAHAVSAGPAPSSAEHWTARYLA